MNAIKILSLDREVTTHTRAGASTEPHRFVQIVIGTGNGSLVAELDAGDWSRALANPGTSVPAKLEAIATPKRAG